MNTFVTHPSVRIKGTESGYNPVQCYDHTCPNKSIHMHCPFCVKTDYYQDPVILKAHYRVKHVDKGIDFAGLKILRCCDHCDIVGIIKGEKKFKGAHWHCYKCRNGFNRRDEAIKHYKTHFRNPQTTFQIQIAQEVNNPNSGYDECNENNSSSLDHGLSIHPALTEAITCMSTSMAEEQGLLTQTSQTSHLTNGKTPDGTVHVSVAANETVDTSDSQTHHIMIIQEDSSSVDNPYTTAQIIANNVGQELNVSEEKDQSLQVTKERKYEELQQKYQDLYVSKTEMEEQFKKEIHQLQARVKDLEEDISSYQKREQELLEQLSVPLDKNIEMLLKQLENQHRDLLHQQLLSIKREFNPQKVMFAIEPKSNIDKSNLTCDQIGIQQETSYNGETNEIQHIDSNNSYSTQQDNDGNSCQFSPQDGSSSNDDDKQTKLITSNNVEEEEGEESSLMEKETNEMLMNSASDIKLVSENNFIKHGEENINMSSECSQVKMSETLEDHCRVQNETTPFVVCIEYSDVDVNSSENLLKTTAALTQNVDLSALADSTTPIELTNDMGEPSAKRLKQ